MKHKITVIYVLHGPALVAWELKCSMSLIHFEWTMSFAANGVFLPMLSAKSFPFFLFSFF